VLGSILNFNSILAKITA